MNWQPYLLRFHQHFPNGYRFLDTAGAFILEASEKFDFMPGEVTPTGGQIHIPEKGIRGSVNSTDLELIQEMPLDEKLFVELSQGMATLSQSIFGPLDLESSNFEMKLLVPMTTEAAVNQQMLKWKNQDFKEISKTLDMVPETTRLDATFSSGSQHLRIVLNPIAFEAVRLHRHNPTLMATRSQQKRANRLTAGADRTPNYAPYAIFLEVGLTEKDPPKKSEEQLFKILLQKIKLAKTLYPLV